MNTRVLEVSCKQWDRFSELPFYSLLELHLMDGNETFWKPPSYFLIGLNTSLVSSMSLGTHDLDIKEDSEDIAFF